jgi:4-oxalocrotonate tautomerase
MELLMPLVRIDLIQGKSSDYRRAIGEVIYEAMLAILNVPKNDRFQVITEHPAEGFIFDPTYLEIQRSSDCIFVQVTLNEGRTVEQKQRFYQAVADGLHRRLALRREDVFINLVEVTKENWSFGNGKAQYVTPPQ